MERTARDQLQSTQEQGFAADVTALNQSGGWFFPALLRAKLGELTMKKIIKLALASLLFRGGAANAGLVAFSLNWFN